MISPSTSSVDRAVFWDWDGTLAQRRATWNGCLLEILDRDHVGHGITPEGLRRFLRNGFPWHDHDEPHLDLCDPDAWWNAMTKTLSTALVGAGANTEVAWAVAEAARAQYVDPAAWSLFPDVRPALQMLAHEGWSHVILSNHVPELPCLVDSLGLTSLVHATVSSAVTGYEKPHVEAYRAALAAAGNPDRVWMVGDNPVADVAGARAAGIPGILVRAPEFTDDYVAGITRSWAGSTGRWAGWRDAASRKATDVAGAAQIILATVSAS